MGVFMVAGVAHAQSGLLDHVSDFVDTPSDFHSASLNWAGYAAQGSVYTGVEGEWVVPEISPRGAHGANATWVGIGGIEGEDLIQAGTAAIEDRLGSVDYFAWFELLPDAAIPLPLDIVPGDTVRVRVQEEWPTYWLITVENVTTGREITIPTRYNSTRSSAEWIQERPVIGGEEFVELSDFDLVEFREAYAIADGKRVSLLESGAQRISMRDIYGETLATPTSVAHSGHSFSVQHIEQKTAGVPIFSLVENEYGDALVVTLAGYSVAFPLGNAI